MAKVHPELQHLFSYRLLGQPSWNSPTMPRMRLKELSRPQNAEISMAESGTASLSKLIMTFPGRLQNVIG